MEINKKDIEKVIRQLGGNGTYKGFKFLIYGIVIAMNNPDLLTYVCKGLYVDIAMHFHTTVECVERDIRTLKVVMFRNGNRELLDEIFGANSYNNIPVNAEFIDGLVAYFIYAY